MYTREEIFYIWIDSFNGLEYKNKAYIAELAKQNDYKQVSEIIKANKPALVSAIGENAYNTLASAGSKEYIEHLLRGFSDRGITPITCVSDDYPYWFEDYNIPPLVLYAKGDVSLLQGELFGIVGSRKSSQLSIKIAEDYTESLVKAGFTMVTGIAEGVDCTVLKKCLEMGGKAISVIAGGFDHIYPSNHAGLVDQLAEHGLVLSENTFDIEPQPYMFPVRNRIIAGLSKGVLVVSGRLKSGTMHTANYAVEYSKDLFAVPYNVGYESGAGCNELIKKDATLTDSPKDILDFYGKYIEEEEIELDQDEKAVCKLLVEGGKHLEQISALCGKGVSEIMPIMSALEIKGVAVKVGANIYALAKNGLEE